VLGNRNVSTAITGASNVDQLRETVAAVELLNRLTPALRDELSRVFDASVVD
jgi:aryl-alcohol dehydrogenase-like predicted oxidoreductase